ncbi:MAG: hypothetical protein KDK70_34250, partial [Myxococcales bacterium]|nr:hypothetical protein [Myxococcales bacterium]
TKVYTDNRTLGRFFIRARVLRRWPDGRQVALPNAPVFFQLVDPQSLAHSRLDAEPLPSKVMDYRLIGTPWIEEAKPNDWGITKGLNNNEWAAVWHAAHEAWDQEQDDARAQTKADGWLDALALASPVDWATIQQWWPSQHKQPYPSLRNTPLWIGKAKERVTYLLGQRLARATHQAEITGVGQRRYMERLEAANALQLPGDPQRCNAPAQDYGGKAGAGIGAVFELGASSMGLAAVTDPNATDHPHAVRCVANANGYAGVVFTPSHLGGDRYRLRVYVDPQWIADQAPGQNLADRRTGTFVVWRNIRLHKYLQLPAPQAVGTAMSAELQTTLDWGDTHAVMHWRPNNQHSDNFAKMHLDSALTALDVFPQPRPEPRYDAVPTSVVTQTNEVPVRRHYRPVSFVPDGFAKQFKRAFCELIDDSSGRAEVITRQELRDALVVGKRSWDNSGRLNKRIHWASLIIDDDTSPFLLTFRSFDEYNRIVANLNLQVQYPALDMGDTERATEAMQAMVEGMLEHFADGGVLPGITLVHVPRGQTWDFRALNLASPITSGYGTASRAFWLSHTDAVYHGDFHIYGATSNAIHEVGHVLGLCHQPPAGGDIADAHQPGLIDPFLKPNDDQVVCVMSYSGCYGDYCGKCLLQLRGWASAHHW